MQTRSAIATFERTGKREVVGISTLWLGLALYGAGTAILVSAHVPHFELAVIALQIFVLLPVLVYGLYFARHGYGEVFLLPSHSSSRLYVFAFLVLALVAGYVARRGVLIPDGSAYRFQATIFANGKLSAPAPLGAKNTPGTPAPVDYAHLLVHDGRWFSKYPVGWPAVLAIPDKLQFGWAVAPLLGGLLLAITGMIAREAFGPRAVAPSLWFGLLSPFWFATCAGRLSEALCGVLVAGACLFCLRAMHRYSMRDFALMYAFLVPAFLVRPYTALVASLVFGISALLWSRGERALLARVIPLSAFAGLTAVALTAWFNFIYTGSPYLSPYALYRGRVIPSEISASPERILTNLLHLWRFSAQSTLVYTFPFVFLLAAYGLWAHRRSWEAWVLALVFPALVIAYLADTAGSASIAGERYWFEGFFGVVVLAARGLVKLVSDWRIPKRPATAAIVGITCAQFALTVATIGVLYSYSEPYARVRAVADKYQNCHCAVFIRNTPPDFYSRNMNLNSANWPQAGVFYFNDPGPQQRQRWANRYGWHSWAVVDYNAQIHRATARMYHEAN